MEIKFKLVNEKEISIIGVEEGIEREVGCVFTPSGSGENVKNAIQVCGISEVFDFWGCSRYIKPKETKERIIDALENKKTVYKQQKDIQIMFSFDTEPSDWKKKDIELSRDCTGCFNHPCTCENKGNHQHVSPYNIKTVQREQDIEERLQFKEGSLSFEERKELLKKLGKKDES